MSAGQTLADPASLSLRVLLLLLVLFSTCQANEDSVVYFGLATAPISLDPRIATDATSTRINRLLYQSLVGIDDRYQAKPACADWQQVDSQVYRFHLLAHCNRFHDGSILNAGDVVATYQWILEKQHASPFRSRLSLIETIRALDERRIEFVLNKADPLFPAYLDIGILPAPLIAQNHAFNQHPVGSGPFRLHRWLAPNRLELSRIEDGLQVNFVRVPNPTVRVLKLLRGEIDMMQNDISPELVRYLDAKPDIQVERHAGSNFTYLGFNMDDPVTGNTKIRQAIAHAIDRKAIIKYLFNHTARRAETLLPPEHWAGSGRLQAYAYNPDLARALMQELGYDRSRPLTISYKTSSDPFRIRLATVIQHQLRLVGFDVHIKSYDWGTFFGDIKTGDFQLYSLSWVGITTPDIYYYVFHSTSVPPDGANRGRYKNARLDTLLERAKRSVQRETQIELYEQIQAILHRDLPYLPLWYEDHIMMSNSRIQSYRMHLDGNYDGLAAIQVAPQGNTASQDKR